MITNKTPPVSISTLYNNMGNLYLDQKKYDRAKSYFLKSLNISKKHNLLLKQKHSIKYLATIAKTNGQFQKATELSEELIGIQENIIKNENAKAIEEMNARYQNEKQLLEIKSLEDENIINGLEIENLHIQRKWIIGVLVSLLLLGILVFNFISKRFKSTLQIKNQQIIQQQEQIDNIQTIVSKQLEDKTNSGASLLSYEEVNELLKSPLTSREYEILVETYNGYSNKVIAERLYLSVNTIKFHLKNIYNKLEVSNRIQALKVITR